MQVLDFAVICELVFHIVFRCLLVNASDHYDPALDGWATS
jgi:hypothetical protein